MKSNFLNQSICDYIKHVCLESSEHSWWKRFSPQTYSSQEKYSSNVCVRVCTGKSQNPQLLTVTKFPSSKSLQIWPVFIGNLGRLGRSKEITTDLASVSACSGRKERMSCLHRSRGSTFEETSLSYKGILWSTRRVTKTRQCSWISKYLAQLQKRSSGLGPLLLTFYTMGIFKQVKKLFKIKKLVLSSKSHRAQQSMLL